MVYRLALVIVLVLLILAFLSTPGAWDWVARRLDDLRALVR